MARINVVGNAIVLSSELKLEDIKKAEKYRPDALVMKDEDGVEVFKVSVGKYPSANEFGITFNGETHGDNGGNATCTWLVDDGIGEDTKETIADLYGSAMIQLGKFETTFPAALEEIKAEREAVLAQITLD